jgi:hypothetical protein
LINSFVIERMIAAPENGRGDFDAYGIANVLRNPRDRERAAVGRLRAQAARISRRSKSGRLRDPHSEARAIALGVFEDAARVADRTRDIQLGKRKPSVIP